MILGRFSDAPHLWRISRASLKRRWDWWGSTPSFSSGPPLSDFRVFELAPSLLSPWPWITLLVLALAVLLRRDPIPRFLILWWAVTLLPCLDVRQLSFPLAGRPLFLPPFRGGMPGGRLVPDGRPARMGRDRSPVRALIPALGLVLVLFTWEDIQAIPRWRDNDTLYDYSYRVSPKSGGGARPSGARPAISERRLGRCRPRNIRRRCGSTT